MMFMFFSFPIDVVLYFCSYIFILFLHFYIYLENELKP